MTNIKEHLDISIEEFKNFVKKNIAIESIILTQSDISEIERIESTYLTDDFIYGKNPNYTVSKKKKTEAGVIEITLELKNNVVKKINMLGDYFLIGDQDEFLNNFRNIEFSRPAFLEVLKRINLNQYIYNLTDEDFLQILF